MSESVEKNAEVLSNEVIDMVNSPPHYKLNGLDIESVDVIRAVLTAEEFRGWCKGNAIKYLMRLGKKDKEIQDARKSIKFLEWLVKELEE
jgi:gp24|nr:MAG TPA: nucelotide kinase [Caudoviricetes sp.]DAR63589.1 MAG TPA: nucelotide kinase [Caudoviricetes sp.]DAR90215.1 MAG TPA: nucelotide kinase [Caudoviricetes sp.]